MGNQKADFGLANFENGHWTAKWKCLVNPLIMSLEFKGQLKDGEFHLNHQIFLCHLGLLNWMRSLHSVILNPGTLAIHPGSFKIKY